MRSSLFLLISALLASPVLAQGAPAGSRQYSGTIELGMTVADFASLASTASPAEIAAKLKGRAFLLLGTLSKPIIAESENFSALATLQQGVWTGTSAVSIVRIYVRFSGDEFADFVEGAKGVRVMALLDSPELAAAPEGGMALFFRVLSIRKTE